MLYLILMIAALLLILADVSHSQAAADSGHPDSLPAMPTVTFQYYANAYNSTPNMSVELESCLRQSAARFGTRVHYVHVGTEGDENHSSSSYHNHTPPDAIDLQKVYADGHLIFNFKNSLTDRQTASVIFEIYGGRCLHVTDSTKHHLHVQV